MRKFLLCALSPVLIMACGGAGPGSEPEEQPQAPAIDMTTPATLTYCCDPDEPPPENGYHVGDVEFVNEGDADCYFRAMPTALDLAGPIPVDVEEEDYALQAGGDRVVFEIWSGTCIQADQTATFVFRDDDTDEVVQEFTVTVKWDCPPEPPPEVETFATCSATSDERFLIFDQPAIFDDADVEVATAGGTEGCRICTLGGPVMREPDALGDYFGCAYLPEVPGAAAVAAPEAMCFYGIGIVGVTSWDEAAGIFGLYGIDGFGRNWTDVAASGDPDATNHFLAVDFVNRRVASIVPQFGFWALQTFTDVVAASKLDSTWGFPVTVFREERTGDICLALAPTQTTPGNFVVASMGGDDVADSCQLIGPTGKFPREMAALNGIYGVTCQGENILSLFRRTATGYEKIKDEVVGNKPIGVATFALANGNVAILTTGSLDDTWSVTEVDPTTGTVVGTTTKPVPPVIDEPSDIQVNSAGDVYILGKTSRNIAKIPGAVK